LGRKSDSQEAHANTVKGTHPDRGPERVGRSRGSILLGSVVVLITSLVATGVVLAFHFAEAQFGIGFAGQIQLHITRRPGNLELPSLDRTIRVTANIAALAADIRDLPPYPIYERCPVSFGTYYTLTFEGPGSSPWSATIEARGCEVVQVPGQPPQWAAHSPQLWADIAVALNLTRNDLQPAVCLTPTDVNCVPIVSSR
jgi:hypothetical protein